MSFYIISGLGKSRVAERGQDQSSRLEMDINFPT